MYYKTELEPGDEVKVTGARYQSWVWSAGTYKVEGKDAGIYRLRSTRNPRITCRFNREQLTLIADVRQAHLYPPEQRMDG